MTTSAAENGMVIDCRACPARPVSEGLVAEHCADCIVAYLIDKPDGAIVFDVQEERALRALRDGGLLPNASWSETG